MGSTPQRALIASWYVTIAMFLSSATLCAAVRLSIARHSRLSGLYLPGHCGGGRQSGVEDLI